MANNPFPALSKIQLGLTSALTLLGLSNVVDDAFDGLIVWYSFMGDIVNVYSLVTQQIVSWLFGWWLWFEFPAWIIDCLVILACLSLALRIFQAGGSDKNNKPIGLFSFVFIVIYMQLLAPGSDETKGLVFGYLKYCFYVIASFVVLLFINWQLLARLASI